MEMAKTALALALVLALPIAQAQTVVTPPSAPHEQPSGANSYAQHLVDSVARLHPELLAIDLHATPAGTTQSTIVASTVAGRVGRPSDADDIAVFRTRQPRAEINRRGDQNVEVALPLFDIFKQTIGSVEFTLRYVPGTDEAALIRQGAEYRDELSRRILDRASLGDPAQLDPRIPTQTYAQYLIDDALARHPEVEVLVLHAHTKAISEGYPIIASNIGRIGKPADASDLAVIESGQAYGQADERGARYEWKLPFADASGTTLGMLAIIFPLRPLTRVQETRERAEKIVAELRQRVASAEALDGPYPPVQSKARAEVIEEYNKQLLGNKQNLPMTKEVASGAALSQSQEGYSEAIKNVAGVAPTNSSGSSNDAYAIRGIKLNLFANYRLDGGLPITGVITNPTENKDRVETLKGANALMFGVASPAGIINFVTKRAGERDVTIVGVAGNGFGQYGGTVDIGRRYGDERQVGVRLNASATHLENGVKDLGGHAQFYSIGLDWRATSRLTFQFDYENYRRQVPEQAGISLLPAVHGVVPLPRVPDPKNLLSGTWDLYTPHTENTQARVDFALTDSWKVLAQAGYSLSARHRTTVRIGNYNLDTGAGGVVSVQPVTNNYRNVFYRTELLGHFTTWSLPHDLTIGASSSGRHTATSDVQNLTLPQKQNIYDPIVLNPPVYTKPGVANPPQDSTDEGIYAYDTIGITQRLRLLLGVRRVKDLEITGTTETINYVTSPAYGVLFDVLPTTTLFASYMQGLEAGATSPANAANPNVTLAPAVSKQKEIGLRDSYFKGLSVSASYFDITRGNAVTDPVSNIFAYSGDLEYKGVESTLTYDFARDWRINAAVLWLDATQNSPLQPLINGRTPENTPKWNGNLGIAYRVPAVPGLQLRGGIKSISLRPANPSDTGTIPGYTLYDFGASYVAVIQGRRSFFQLAVDNLANKRFWNSVNAGTYGIGMDRTIKFNARVDF
jgi:iron complex outermembrane receptor protein